MPLCGIGGAGARGLALRAGRGAAAGRQAASPLPVWNCNDGKPSYGTTGNGKTATDPADN